jgi:hypothetical protein
LSIDKECFNIVFVKKNPKEKIFVISFEEIEKERE